jgi:hypothetical protein
MREAVDAMGQDLFGGQKLKVWVDKWPEPPLRGPPDAQVPKP